jgi:hypothetical protein
MKENHGTEIELGHRPIPHTHESARHAGRVLAPEEPDVSRPIRGAPMPQIPQKYHIHFLEVFNKAQVKPFCHRLLLLDLNRSLIYPRNMNVGPGRN